jgi:hypothetical protein
VKSECHAEKQCVIFHAMLPQDAIQEFNMIRDKLFTFAFTYHIMKSSWRRRQICARLQTCGAADSGEAA